MEFFTFRMFSFADDVNIFKYGFDKHFYALCNSFPICFSFLSFSFSCYSIPCRGLFRWKDGVLDGANPIF